MQLLSQEVAPALVDDSDFGVSVAPYLLDMGRLAARLVGDRDADDVVQEALTRAWRRRSTFDHSRGALRPWLLAITADQARRWLIRAPRPVEPAATAADPDPDAALDLRAAVARLPQRQRLAVELRYYLELPVLEVAEVMAVSEGTAKSTLSDARARLRLLLGET